MRRQQPDRRQRTVILAVLGGVLFLCFLIPVLGWIVSRQVVQTATGSAQVDERNATLTVAYSPEKAALIKSLADKFNAQGLRTPDRQAMRVELMEMTPEDMVTQALAGAPFQALTPDSSMWLDQINRRWAQSQPEAGPGRSHRGWPVIRCATPSARSSSPPGKTRRGRWAGRISR